MVEMVVREKTTLEEWAGRRMHAPWSGCGHYLGTPSKTRDSGPRLPVLPPANGSSAAGAAPGTPETG